MLAAARRPASGPVLKTPHLPRDGFARNPGAVDGQDRASSRCWCTRAGCIAAHKSNNLRRLTKALSAHWHEGGRRRGRLGEHATALERRGCTVQRADRQPMPFHALVHRLSASGVAHDRHGDGRARIGRAPWDAPLSGFSPEPSLSPSHRTLEGVPWHERHSYEITYFSGRLRTNGLHDTPRRGVAVSRAKTNRTFRGVLRLPAPLSMPMG